VQRSVQDRPDFGDKLGGWRTLSFSESKHSLNQCPFVVPSAVQSKTRRIHEPFEITGIQFDEYLERVETHQQLNIAHSEIWRLDPEKLLKSLALG